MSYLHGCPPPGGDILLLSMIREQIMANKLLGTIIFFNEFSYIFNEMAFLFIATTLNIERLYICIRLSDRLQHGYLEICIGSELGPF